ncbi:hypothetical protein [uncultured Sphingomonas sp.]|uniref:phage tail assembly chaperone n=1 Tax=uncultured Sphingomonas sp. TaxID=158754 RepID=UPI0025EEFF6E|nr:hypothetical protein [uncultured Sphingomonas sp.]
MAWLNATPKPPAGSRRAKAEATHSISRRDRLKRDRIPPPMPPNPAPHIIDRLIEIGLTEAAGMGAGPLSWATIVAWQQATGIRLPPWEARLIRRLSVDYLAESRRAEDETCPPPWRGTVSQAEIDSEAQRLRDLLG